MEEISHEVEWDYTKLIMNHLSQITMLMTRPESGNDKKGHLVLMVFLLETYIPDDLRNTEYKKQLQQEFGNTDKLTYQQIFERMKYSIDLLSRKGLLIKTQIESMRL
jgi:hypothetical protein